MMEYSSDSSIEWDVSDAESDVELPDVGDAVGGTSDGVFADESRRALIMANYQVVADAPKVLPSYSLLAPRRAMKRNPWVRKTTVPTQYIYQWFEAQVSGIPHVDSIAVRTSIQR